MRPITSLLAATALLAMGFAGCEDAARKPAQARVPALQPTLQASKYVIDQNAVGPLPVWNPATRPPASLLPPVPDGKDWLIARVEQKFAEGEQEYKAGHLEAARKDFDEAVDSMLESGY